MRTDGKREGKTDSVSRVYAVCTWIAFLVAPIWSPYLSVPTTRPRRRSRRRRRGRRSAHHTPSTYTRVRVQ